MRKVTRPSLHPEGSGVGSDAPYGDEDVVMSTTAGEVLNAASVIAVILPYSRVDTGDEETDVEGIRRSVHRKLDSAPSLDVMSANAIAPAQAIVSGVHATTANLPDGPAQAEPSGECTEVAKSNLRLRRYCQKSSKILSDLSLLYSFLGIRRNVARFHCQKCK